DFTRMFGQSGFIEDENLGIAHFLHKLKPQSIFIKKYPMPSDVQLPMALIIGSGPSIDKQINYIKKVQNQCIIFSCSSSIEILYNNNIIPDFHVEIERTHIMMDRL